MGSIKPHRHEPALENTVWKSKR